MTRERRFHYYVEGECEKRLIEVFKEHGGLIVPGKVDVFNVVNRRLSEMHLRAFRQNTIVILVFDTDTKDTSILEYNISFLRKASNVKAVWCIPQVCCFEDELCRATDLKRARDLIGSLSDKEFKHDFLKEKNVFLKLEDHGFDISKLWASEASGPFAGIQNSGKYIKLK